MSKKIVILTKRSPLLPWQAWNALARQSSSARVEEMYVTDSTDGWKNSFESREAPGSDAIRGLARDQRHPLG